jgi:hypothetical protein
LTEVLEEQRFLRSIESIKDWFKYAAEERHRRFTSLILVTGAIKCKSWSVAAISNSSRSNSGKVSLSLVPAASSTLTASHCWREYRSNMCSSGPDPPSHIENQCVFIRGYRMMKQSPALRLLRKVKASDLQAGNIEYYNLAKPAVSRVTSASGSEPAQNQRLPAGASGVSIGHPDSDTALTVDGDDDYVVGKLSEADQVRTPSHLCHFLSL